ncbi:MAG: SUKH-4 family immunity protein [Blastocatellia bacterium]|nr:SUKH-4 family immunity protein [Blastocatellia bacterium]
MTEIISLAPGVRQALFEEGIPAFFFHRRYRADLYLSVVHRKDRSPVICFGRDGGEGVFGIDVVSGHVIRVLDRADNAEEFVNATVNQFTKTVRALAWAFPYYRSDAWYEEIPVAVERLRTLVESTDSGVIARNGYWADFVYELDGMMFDVDEMREWHLRQYGEFSSSSLEMLDWRRPSDGDGRLF